MLLQVRLGKPLDRTSDQNTEIIMMDVLKEKVESLNKNISTTEARTEEINEEIKRQEEKHAQNIREIEDLKRYVKETRKNIEDTNDKIDQVENQVLRFQRVTRDNNVKINKLESRGAAMEEESLKIEGKIAEAKDLHMELSGEYQQARSRKQLIQSELKKVQELLAKNEKRRDELTRMLSRHNSKLGKLAISSDKDTDSKESAEENEKEMAENLQMARSKQRVARQEVITIQLEIKKRMDDIERVKKQKEDVEKELKQIIDELDKI